MSTPRRAHLVILALIVWSVSALPAVRAADMEPAPVVEALAEDAAQIHREVELERPGPFTPGAVLGARGGGPPVQTGPCVTEQERAAIQEAIQRYLQLKGAISSATAAVTPSKYPFYPMGGRLYRDLFTVNFNDLDPTSPGILDWDCTDFTYDGHDATDVDLRTFTEQEIGVPIFAALDGVVVEAHDGEPDHNTTQPNVPANYVVIDHGSGRFCSYFHMRLGSVMVSSGQPVKAGEQIGFTASSGRSSGPHLHFATYDYGARTEPYTGPCNPGESQWVDQTPILRDMYLRDLNITNVDISLYPGLPWDMPRTGTFVQGTQTVYFWINLMNEPANTSWQVRFQRPDSSIAFDSGLGNFGNPFYRWSWWWWGFNVNLNVTGAWHLLLNINGNMIASAPFDVVSSAGQIVNRPPFPITVSLDPPVPAVADTIFCLVHTDLVLDDPDYDVVRYHYVWTVNGQIVRDLISAGHADAIPHHTASPTSLLVCTVTPSDGKDNGAPVSVSAVLNAVSKFDQPPDGSGEAIASNIDLTDMSPNVVVADDFVSDGRPVTGVRWWGSGLAPPSPDGWLISFHEPLATGGSPQLPLGLYFCDPGIVTLNATTSTACDARPVVEYEVSLENCCLIHSTDDSRNHLRPAQTDAFHEQLCFQYDIDIQAVVGHRFIGAGGSCTEVSTGNTATSPFWGWHSTGIESGNRGALQTAVTMSGSDWLYGPWTPVSTTCSAPNMSFQLLTDQNSTTIDCNNNGKPDVCEAAPDCQPNGTLDECDIANGTSRDCNRNGVPDECELAADPDCNRNGILDACDNQSVASLSGTLPAVLGFVDISGSGTPLNLGDDGTATVVMPFVSAAFDSPRVVVSNNGVAAFAAAFTAPNPNHSIPNPSVGNDVLLVFWDDFDATTGNVYHATTGTTPSRTFIIEWKDRPHFPGDAVLNGDEATFEIQIFETPVGGVVAQYLYADTNFLNANFNDGRSATVGYQRNATSAIQWSFNTAGAVTAGTVISLLFGDLNGNGRPDDCDPRPVIVWNADPQSADRATRSLRFGVTAPVTASSLAEQDAIKVTMVDLQNPVPANAPCCPPQNFSAYESATCTASGEGNGCARWVGRPGTFLESQDSPALGSYRAARLQCTPFYYDWITETAGGPITVVGAEILPSSEYSVQTYGASCMGNEATCTNISAAATVYTRRSGDVESLYNPPDPSGQPNAIDIAQLVAKFKNTTGAPVKARAQIQPNLPELNGDISALDISAVVDAVKGLAYSYSGPCPCPSAVVCGATACPSGVGTCITAYGPGAMCVKTCSGGANDGQPCVDNNPVHNHCPSGTCGNPTCRDRCGRCTP